MLNDLVWLAKDVLKIELGLYTKKVPHMIQFCLPEQSLHVGLQRFS